MDRIALPPALIVLTAHGLRLAEQSLPVLPKGTDIHGLEPRCQGAPVSSGEGTNAMKCV